MTARIGTMSVDGTPISQADKARIEAEAKLHTTQQHNAVRVVAAGALDADDCRLLLSVLGLDTEVAAQVRTELATATAPAHKRTRKPRAA